MDRVVSLMQRILATLAVLVNLYTVYCLQSNVNTIGNVLNNTFLKKTIVDNNRQEDLRQDMEKKLLTIMGLHQRRNLTKLNAFENSAVPYMLEIYKMINDDDGREGLGTEPSRVNTAFNNTYVPDRHEIKGTSLVMSFGNQAHKLHSLPHQKKGILYFDFMDVLPGVVATHAEVQIYKERTTIEDRFSYLIETFLIRRGTNNEEMILQPVANLSVSKSYEGWLSMKVTNAAKYWTVNRKQNLGLYMQVTDVEIGQYIDPYKSGIVGEDGSESKRTFMISYFKNPNEDHVPYTRSKRQVPDISATNVSTEGDFNADFLQPYLASQTMFASYKREEICKRHEMYVNFTDLGWNSWITAPVGYQAYFCAGDCRFPLADHLNPSVHAILQVIQRNINPAISKVCCVPTKMSPINILYMSNNTVVVAKYPNMVVDACGCR
ncbi:hypothetical protein CHS0354_034234 [Potamilus streckersoni]|uniref:TGF-beta family profile domain-containing protein n=1 Tax=Potamilus streckersoni TaxID=2493646 RepID=A0AAE0SVE0_9BIVA|nr:hypothetical protein CHS0354_034234 [Potamilus streckersoni]